MADSCLSCQPGNFIADRTTGTVLYGTLCDTGPLHFLLEEFMLLIYLKWIICHSSIKAALGEPVASLGNHSMIILPITSAVPKKRNRSWGALPETEEQASIYPSSFPHSLWNRAALNPRHLSVFNLQTLLSVPQVFIHLFSLRLERLV